MTRQISVFGSSATPPGDPDYVAGVRCGFLLAEAGFAVATGGYGGLMEAVSLGAAEAGGHVVGVTAPDLFPARVGANQFVGEERPAPSLTARIGDMLANSAGFIALQGSIGTMTELLVAWNDSYITALSHDETPPLVAVGPMWRGFVEQITTELATDGSLVTCVDDVDTAVAVMIERLG